MCSDAPTSRPCTSPPASPHSSTTQGHWPNSLMLRGCGEATGAGSGQLQGVRLATCAMACATLGMESPPRHSMCSVRLWCPRARATVVQRGWWIGQRSRAATATTTASCMTIAVGRTPAMMATPAQTWLHQLTWPSQRAAPYVQAWLQVNQLATHSVLQVRVCVCVFMCMLHTVCMCGSVRCCAEEMLMLAVVAKRSCNQSAAVHCVSLLLPDHAAKCRLLLRPVLHGCQRLL